MTFDIPKEKLNLMKEYKTLIIKKIQKEGLLESTQDIKEVLNPLNKNDLIEIMIDAGVDLFDGSYPKQFVTKVIKEFVEERIGEDFVVLEGLRSSVFCLHTFEDFVKNYIHLTKEEAKNILHFKKEIAFDKMAA